MSPEVMENRLRVRMCVSEFEDGDTDKTESV